MKPFQPERGDNSLDESLDRLLELGARGLQPAGDESVDNDDSGCPQAGVWQRVASHRMDAKESRALISHATGCHRCGQILQFWGTIISDEISAAESTQLAQLSTLQPAWQEQMAKAMYAAGGGRAPRASGGRALWPAVMAAAGLAAAGLFFLFFGSFHSQPSPERLLAEAYADHRIMDARIPLADFAPVDAAHHSRAAAAATLSDSVPLLEARASISQALMKAPEDPHWLLLQARSDLLNANYNSAIDTLKRLHAMDPDNVPVLTDLASAYVMRSKDSDVATDQANALDFLEHAVRLQPDNPVVLYNEAVLLQDLFQYSNATEAWKKFLAVEHDRSWIEDGKRRLAEIAAIQARVKAHQSRLDPQLSHPDGMLHLARSPALLSEYDEQLSTIYLPQILKAAFPTVSPSADESIPKVSECDGRCGASRVLLYSIASSLEQRHGDPWLSDMLAGYSKPGFSAAVNALADAIMDSTQANPQKALDEATAAESSFQRIGNLPGAAFSRAEQVYDLEHLSRVNDCLATINSLPSNLPHRYPLIGIRLWTDKGICYALQSDYAAGGNALARSMRLASGAGYHDLYLRALGMTAAAKGEVGDRDTAWSTNMQVLKLYWTGNYPDIRRLLPYVDLADDEATSNRFYAAVALRREASSESEMTANTAIASQNKLVLVRAEIRANEMREAAHDLKIAESEFASVPGHEKLRGHAADSGTYLAEAYLTRNDLAAAAAMLSNVESKISGSGDRDTELRYAAASGHLALLQGKTEEAEDKLTRAITSAELTYNNTDGVRDRVDWIEKVRDVYAELATLRLREGRTPVEALAVWERYRILSGGSTLQRWCRDSQELTCLVQPLEDARKALHHETILGTIRLDRSLLMWLMDDRGVQIHEVSIDPERFDILCHTFSETLATPSSNEASIRFYGDKLAATLLSPNAAGFDQHRSLIFDLDDSMEFLSAGALPWNGNYLGLQLAISTVHSVLMADRAEVSIGGSLDSLVIGASDPGDPEVSRLPEAKTEALAVADLLTRPKVFTGSHAIVSSIASAVPHPALIHFAGHATFTAQGTQLLLAQPAGHGVDRVDAHYLQSSDLKGCRLVVLSACSTGKREEEDSDGIEDIAQMLTTKGVQQIVVTHWNVDSAASVSLMTSFYAGLARGLAVPLALLEAKRAVRATAEYRHPYYWGSYYAIGMGRSNLKELFRHERPNKYDASTGFPGRNPL
jgi:CHAT domain-containing protein/tetratricopeptide (TPR) repeat protein